MTGTQTPPVNEVVLSVAIAPQDLLTGPLLYQLLGGRFDTFPEIRAVPPYEMPMEHPQPQMGLRPPFPQIEIIAPGMPARYWLSSPDHPYLLQVQRDYLALNWRRRGPESDYVHYDAIRAEFVAVLDEISRNLQERGGELRPMRAELTYIDVIEPNELWARTGELHRLFRLSFPGETNYEQLSFAYSKPIAPDDYWMGRMHLNVQSGFDVLKDEPRLSMTLTARTGPMPVPSMSAALQFLDIAHDQINETFRDFLTDEARQIWGLA
ncbi:MAG TPA: TIGR04255 family protein [Mycobacteriales bacterium]|nr:TIGR04255 family protein [Mycobacteriales bacterium]